MDQTPESFASAIQPLQVIPQAFSIVKIYTNSFSLGMSASDLFLILMNNGQPTAQVNMSLVTAKSILNAMQHALDEFEKKTGLKIPDINEVQKLLKP